MNCKSATKSQPTTFQLKTTSLPISTKANYYFRIPSTTWGYLGLPLQGWGTALKTWTEPVINPSNSEWVESRTRKENSIKILYEWVLLTPWFPISPSRSPCGLTGRWKTPWDRRSGSLGARTCRVGAGGTCRSSGCLQWKINHDDPLARCGYWQVYSLLMEQICVKTSASIYVATGLGLESRLAQPAKYWQTTDINCLDSFWKMKGVRLPSFASELKCFSSPSVRR